MWVQTLNSCLNIRIHCKDLKQCKNPKASKYQKINVGFWNFFIIEIMPKHYIKYRLILCTIMGTISYKIIPFNMVVGDTFPSFLKDSNVSLK
jgi:hypothetical protein